MGEFFFEISIIIAIAAVLAIVFRALKQPAILAYILTGILIGPLHIFPIHGTESLESLAEIGITLLLFMLGLELRLSELRSVGKVALMTGIGQILFTSFIGYFLCILLGFSSIASLYISIALTFSSTIIIVKLLSDKKDLQSLYGKIAVGFLLVQDFFAIIALIVLAGFAAPTGDGVTWQSFAMLLLKAVILFGWVIVLSNTLFPKLLAKISKSTEVLFLFSLAWAFGLSAFVSAPFMGFSIEIGGFLAGLALANSSANLHIVSKIRPLRDFFITIFFVVLGMKLVFDSVLIVLIPAILLSMFVLIGNPIIVMIILGLMGYKKRTSFLAGLTVAQISEFSLIVIVMGTKIGHLSDEVISLVTLVGAITFVASTYMVMNSNYLYKKLSPLLSIFERKNTKETYMSLGQLQGHIVLIGANRMGQHILESLKNENQKIVVVDFNPDIIKHLHAASIASLFGDIADSDIREKAQLESAKLIISTVPDLEDNLILLSALKEMKTKAKIIVEAYYVEEAKVLYEAGADYVLLPHIVGGKHLIKLLKGDLDEILQRLKKNDIAQL